MFRNVFVSFGLFALIVPSSYANVIFRSRIPDLMNLQQTDLVVENLDGSIIRNFETPASIVAIDDWNEQELLGLSTGSAVIVGINKTTGEQRTVVSFGDLGISSLLALTHYREGVVATFDGLSGEQSILLIDLDSRTIIDGFFPVFNDTGSSLRGLDTDAAGRLIASGAGLFEIDLDTGALTEFAYSQSLLSVLGFQSIRDFDISTVEGREVITGHAGDFGQVVFQADYATGDLLWKRNTAADFSLGLAVSIPSPGFGVVILGGICAIRRRSRSRI